MSHFFAYASAVDGLRLATATNSERFDSRIGGITARLMRAVLSSPHFNFSMRYLSKTKNLILLFGFTQFIIYQYGFGKSKKSAVSLF
jgi:hypothetical protein